MNEIINNNNINYQALQKSIDLIVKRYPFLSKMSIGKSVLGRDITAIKIGKSDNSVLFASAFHGNEHITTNIIMLWLNDICEAIENDISIEGIRIRKAVENSGIIIIPRINPDGCEIAIEGKVACDRKAKEITALCYGNYKDYKANYRGVDINHNFNAGWKELREKEKKMGIFGPAPSRFGGLSPESEPETKAICDLCRNTKIRHAIAIHSQGRVIYWSYGNNKPPRSQKMAEILATASGYSLDYAIGIANGGGFKDWFIREFNRPAFTFEVGKGKNPLPISTANEIYTEVKKAFILSVIL